MNKKDFLKFLKTELDVLQDREIEEILSEYAQHIDMKVEAGFTEEEAIKDFGDLDEFVSEILAAYKVDYQENKRAYEREMKFDAFANRIKHWLTLALDFVNQIANGLMTMSGSEIIRLIVEFFIVMLVILMVHGGSDMIISMFQSLFYFRPYFITNILRMILGFIGGVFKLFVTVLILYWFANERMMRFSSEHQTSQPYQKEKTFKETENQQEDLNDFNYNDRFEERDDHKTFSRKTNQTFFNTMKRFIIWCLRAVGIMMMIPVVICVALAIVATVWFALITMAGVGSWGILCISLGILIIMGSIVYSVYDFVMGGSHS